MHRNAGTPNWKYICIHFQCGVPASQWIYSSPKRRVDDQTERHKITKGPRTTRRTDGQMDGHIIRDLRLHALRAIMGHVNEQLFPI